jgi:hypothetical protein
MASGRPQYVKPYPHKGRAGHKGNFEYLSLHLTLPTMPHNIGTLTLLSLLWSGRRGLPDGRRGLPGGRQGLPEARQCFPIGR